MSPWNFIFDALGWIIIVVVGLVLLTVFVAIIVGAYRDLLSIDRRRRAHAGRLRCEEPSCRMIAIARTPLGYFCNDHQAMRSTEKTPTGSVSWSNLLDHARSTSRDDA